MFFRKKHKRLGRAESLKTVPVRNKAIEESRSDDGTVNLFIPRRDTWWIKAISKVFFVPKGRRVALDELGTTVWGWIDDRNNVETLIEKFAQHYKLSKREAELSIKSYLQTLGRRGVIGLAVFEETGKKKKKKKIKNTGKR